MKERIETTLRDAARLHEALLDQADLIERMARLMARTLAKGGRIYVMGNGGSAADAQHMAGEMVGHFLLKDRAPLPCQALTTDTSVLTSLGNDFGMEQVFAKQIEAFARRGDAVVGISTSGNSANVLLAIEEANHRGAVTIGLTGRHGGRLAALCDLCLTVPADLTPRIQEAHATVIHILCDLVEQMLQERPGQRKA